MKKSKVLILVCTLLLGTLSFTACKSKDTKNSESTVTADTSLNATPTETAPVIASDDALRSGVTDAIKDYPSVNAEVADSVITLSGEIQRSDWQKLMPTLSSLHPKRVNSANLTIK